MKKVLVIITLIVLVAAGVGAYYLSTQVGENQSPEDSDASATPEQLNPITFDDMSSYPEDTAITNQYQSTYGITFSGQGGNSCTPRLCKEGGSEQCGFTYQGGDDSQEVPDGAAPRIQPGRQWTPNFMALNEGCSLVINFSQETTKFSFDILDIDTAGSDNEAWKVETFKGSTQVGGVPRIDKTDVDELYPNCRECGDGRTTRVDLVREDGINKIVVSPLGNDASFGLGFDNFTPFSIPGELSPLTIDKESSVSQSGNTVTINYTLTVTNPNDRPVYDVIVKDVLPNEVQSVSAISNNGTYDATSKTVLWTIDGIGGGGTRTRTFTATFNVADGANAEFNNVGIVYVDDDNDGTGQPREEDDRDEVTDPVTGPGGENPDTGELTINKTSTTTTNSTSKVATYSIRVRNTSDTDKVVSVRDDLDDKVENSWVSQISDNGILSDQGIIRWNNKTVPAGGSVVYTYVVTIPLTETGQYDNVAVLYDEDNTEIDRDDDSVNVTNTTEPNNDDGELTVNKTSTTTTNSTSKIATYKIRVRNTYDSDKTVTVRDTLDDKVENSWVTQISDNGILSNEGIIRWLNRTVPANGSVIYTYVVTVPLTETGQYDNLAVLYDEDDTEIDNDGDTINVTNTPNDDDGEVTISKTSSVANITGYRQVTYTITLENSFDTAQSGLDVVDDLDADVQDSWVSNISNSGVLANGEITWTNLTVTAGGTLALTYRVTIPNSAVGTYENVASVNDSNDEELDSDDETVIVTSTGVTTSTTSGNLPSTAISTEKYGRLVLGIFFVIAAYILVAFEVPQKLNLYKYLPIFNYQEKVILHREDKRKQKKEKHKKRN